MNTMHPDRKNQSFIAVRVAFFRALSCVWVLTADVCVSQKIGNVTGNVDAITRNVDDRSKGADDLVHDAGDYSTTMLDAGEQSKTREQSKKSDADSTKASHLPTVVIPDNMICLDTIKAVIYTEDEAVIITQLDIDRPTLDGQRQNFDELLFQELVFQDAKKFKMVPDEEAIDKHIKVIQRDNNLTLDEFTHILKSAGYTLEQGRVQLAKMSTISSMIDFKIRSRLVVPEKDIVAYYEEHKETRPTEYQIERTVVSFLTPVPKNSQQPAMNLQDALIEFSQTGQGFSGIVWSEPFWVAGPDLTEDKRAAFETLAPSQMTKPVLVDDGFELFKLIAVKPACVVPLADCAREIANILRKPLFDQLLQQYRQELFKNASIVYYDKKPAQ